MNIKAINLFSSFLVGIFGVTDILQFIELITKKDVSLTGSIIIQGIYVIGLIAIVLFYWLFVNNIEKSGVFTHRNRKLLLVFGIIILLSGLTSALLFSWFTEISNTGSRMLGIIGGTLSFISYVFKVGIKMNEEQELTI